jgi:hypothetical protein
MNQPSFFDLFALDINRFALASVFACGSLASCSSSSPATSPNDASSDVSTAADNAAGPTDTDATPDEGGIGSDEGGITPDDGPSKCNGAGPPEGGLCSSRMPSALTIIGATYSTAGSIVTYGAAPDLWNVYTRVAPGQRPVSVTPSAGAIAISTKLTAMGWAAVGIAIDGTECLDETNYARGLLFDLSGDLGGCSLYVEVLNAPDENLAYDRCRGECNPSVNPCIAPKVQVTQMGAVTLLNAASFSGGSPIDGPATYRLIGFRWRLQAPGTGAGCTANITLGNVRLFGI